MLPSQIDSAKQTGEKVVVHVVGNVQVPVQRAFGAALYKHLPGLLEAGDIKVCARHVSCV